MTTTDLVTGHFSSFDGTQIYYESRGKGEPVVLIYGIACLMNHWHHQMEFLAQDHQVITFDLRGHHKSAIPEDKKNLTIEAIAKDIPLLLKALGLSSAHFAGHSFGVQVLLAAHSQNPEMFRTVSFVNGFAKNPIKGMFGLDVIEPLFHFIKSSYQRNPGLIESLWNLGVNNPVAGFGAALVGGFNLKLTEFKDIEIYMRGVSQLSLGAFIPLFENMMEFRGDVLAEKITVPSLIIAGDKDLVTPMKFQHELHEKIAGSELLVVPYGSHCTQLDFPDFVNLKLRQFMTDHS